MKLRHIICLLLIIILCTVLVPSWATPVYAAETSHGYLENFETEASASVKEPIPGFEFKPSITEYNLTLLDSVAGRFVLTVSDTALQNKNLGCTIFLNDKRVSSCTKPINTKTTYLPMAQIKSLLRMGKDNILSLRIGNKTGMNVTDYDEYIIHVTVKPGLSKLELCEKDNEGNIQVSPNLNSGAQCYFTDTFTALASSENVVLRLNFAKQKNVQCFVGKNRTPYEANSTLSIHIPDFIEEESLVAKIPIYLIYGDKENPTCENTFYLLIADSSKFSPVISGQSKNQTCNKLEPVTLHTEVSKESKEQHLTYQWYKGESTSNMKMIPGATDADYVIKSQETSRAGKLYYYCEVTNTVDLGEIGTIKFATKSQIIEIDVQLSFVSEPVILQDLGTFLDLEQSKSYKTQYKTGQKFDAMAIWLKKPEAGVTYSYSYYTNTQPKFEGADFLQVTIENGSEGYSAEKQCAYVMQAVAPVNGFQEGVYYIYCVITAIGENGQTAQTISNPVRLEFTRPKLDCFKGSGTQDDPYLIESEAEFARIREYVNNGEWCSGVSFRMTKDIKLSSNWKPIGEHNPEHSHNGNTVQAFGGTLDGNGHKLIYSENSLPLFNFVSDAVIRNLNIYGEKINGCGLIAKDFVDYGPDNDYWTGVPDCVTIENTRLLKGSSTLMSGFMIGSGSGANTITLRNCIVEDGVTVGYDKTQANIGSFIGGSFNGQMDNCQSFATVYGTTRVGGLAGRKGQSMGLCVMRNCSFQGKIEATNDWVGGLIGCGYGSESAPGTPPVQFQNCFVAADISGNDYVGGLFGGEPILSAPVNLCDISDNFYYGTLTSNKEHIGGIIGWYEGASVKTQFINNNYFFETSNKDLKPLGGNSYYYGPEDEKEAFFADMGHAKTAEEFKDGTVLKLLNESSDFKNWEQGEKYPVLSTKPVVYDLELSGTYKTDYVVGEKLDFSDMRIVALYTDGRREPISLDQVTLTGFDSTKHGKQEVTIQYQGAQKTVSVTVLKAGSGDITVSFTLLGDTVHGTGDDVHTLHNNNLTTWIEQTEYTVDQNATVKDVIDQAVTTNHITVSNPTGNYIESITYGDITLKEFSNGENSGWMYTLNGVHPDLGIAEQYLEDQDEIILHYTDDYTLETDEGSDTKPEPGEGATDEDIRKAYQESGDKQAEKTPSTGSIGGEWMMLGLARAEHEITPECKQTYLDAVKTVINTSYQDGKLDQNNSTENSRLILALTALGEDPATFVQGKNLLSGLADFDWVKQQGINGPIWALIALDSQNYEIPNSTYTTQTTRELLVQYIINSQVTGGGWSTGKDKADADMTAMAIQALAPYTKTNAAAKNAVDTAIAKLSKMQNTATGAFENYKGTVNAESTAQVIVALTTMGINPKSDPRFITISNFSAMDGLMLFYNENGQFKHIVNGRANDMATEQSYYALAAYYRLLNKQTSLYDMTDLLHTFEVKVESGKNGKVTVTPQKAEPGQTVTVQVKPDTGYELDKLMIDGTEKSVDNNGKVTFTMPDHDVTVSVSFKQSDNAVAQVAEAMSQLRLSSYSASKENYEELKKVEDAYKALTADQQQLLKNEYPDAYENYEKQRSRFEDAREGKLERYTDKLDIAFERYDKTKYSNENWEKLQSLYEDALNQLQNAPHADAMAQIVDSFKKAAQDIPSGSDLHVTFRLIGDFNHGTADEHTSYVTWVETTDYQLNAGATVYDLFVEAMDDAKLDYEGAETNYVSTIQAPDILGGYWLSEFDNGKNSGWMYTVNGEHPSVGLKDCELEDQDEVIWHYVDDYAKEENSNTWLEAKDISPKEYVESNLDEILKIGEHGKAEPDQITLQDLGTDVSFKFKPDKGYEVKAVTVDGESKGSITDYTYENLTIFSRIEVEFQVKDEMDFVDVGPNDWFYDDVRYAVSADLFKGTSDTTFSPYQSMTRAMMVTVLYRMEGEPEVTGHSDFSDVDSTIWYSDAVKWAAENGIVSGIGNNRFAPGHKITREQIATILYRYANYRKCDTSASTDLTGYSDYDRISTYALEPLQWANANGLIIGRTATTLVPAGTATRAETAAILHRFAEKVVE